MQSERGSCRRLLPLFSTRRLLLSELSLSPRRRTSRRQGGAFGTSRVCVEELHQFFESSDRCLANPRPFRHAHVGGRTTFSILVCFRRHQQNLDKVRACSVLDVTLNISTKDSQAVARQTPGARARSRTRAVRTLGTIRITTTPDLTTIRLLPPENS